MPVSVGGAQYRPDVGVWRSWSISTRVDPLMAGVDVPAGRDIVSFPYVHSPIAFYRMLGRDTRLNATTEKLRFRIDKGGRGNSGRERG